MRREGYQFKKCHVSSLQTLRQESGDAKEAASIEESGAKIIEENVSWGRSHG